MSTMETIRVAGTEFSLKNKSYEIYIQGCWRNCKGCQNPDTHSFTGGKEVNIKDFLKETYNKIYPFIKCGLIKNLYVSGGDLLCWNYETAETFSSEIDYWFRPLVRTWLFTGAGVTSALPNWVWNYYDVIKCGEYREDLRNPDGTFPASSNQILVFNKGLTEDCFNSMEFSGVKAW